jgi:hypothetical protein
VALVMAVLELGVVEDGLLEVWVVDGLLTLENGEVIRGCWRIYWGCTRR